MIKRILTRLKKHQFAFEELVKRDFKQKYKGTVLGMGWSVLSPLLHLLVMPKERITLAVDYMPAINQFNITSAKGSENMRV